MEATTRPPAWKTLLAFAIIYFVWGSTYLAIRVGVREVPPFLLAGMRFVAAGVILYAWMRLKGDASPTLREWRSATLLAVLIFVFDYGFVFWAERRVTSGVAAVMMATIPVFMAVGNHSSGGAKTLSSIGNCSSGWDQRRGRAGEPFRDLRRRPDRHRRCNCAAGWRD
jgi:drug/metabolite transporter (DMT)-like permease